MAKDTKTTGTQDKSAQFAAVVAGVGAMLRHFDVSPTRGKEESTGGMSHLLKPAAAYVGVTLTQPLAVRCRRILFREIRDRLIEDGIISAGTLIPNNDEGKVVLYRLPKEAAESAAHAAIAVVEAQAAVAPSSLPDWVAGAPAKSA